MKINGRQVKKGKGSKDNHRKQQVFIIGSKGIPANYGGFETFVEKLTEYRKSGQIDYHIACMGKDNRHYEYNGAECFHIPVLDIGAAKAVYYDIAALEYCIQYCQKRSDIKNPVFYILACRIGPFIGHYKKKIRKLGGVLYLNPDGHEWKRAKWNWLIQKYWKLSEKLMVKYADLLICDSRNIAKYIEKEYRKYAPETKFIAYGSDTKKSILEDDDKKFLLWMKEKGLVSKNYYLAVGRFVPENNFETMIREFMESESKKDFAMITTVNDRFLNELEKKLHFIQDKRIKFVGTVYDQELLKKIRENAYGYLHGHEVGGTNPSLLEALGSTDLNLLLDVGFNREVAEDGAVYWKKERGNLRNLLNKLEQYTEKQREEIGKLAKERVEKEYSWDHIVDLYEKVFLDGGKP